MVVPQITMQSFSDDGEDVFFDTSDSIRVSIDSASSEGYVAEIRESLLSKFECEFWSRELMSVHERRSRFLRRMELDEFVSPQFSCSQGPREATSDRSAAKMEVERITESSGAVLDTLPSPDNGGCSDSDCCIRDLDSGKRFIVQDAAAAQDNGLFSMLREVGSDRLITLQEFEALLGLSRSVQQLMQRAVTPSLEEGSKRRNAQRKNPSSWWRSFMQKRPGMGMCKPDVSAKIPKLSTMIRTRVQRHCKKCLEFTERYMVQEIQAHKGLIRVMRFSPSGCYLASGGEDSVVRIWQVGEVETSCKCFATDDEDCVVLIWQVGEVEASCKCFTTDDSSRCIGKIRDKRLRFGGKGDSPSPIAIPKTVFKIGETPLQEFHGHTSDILDLSWSSTNCLLSSSKDKTVRLWKVGCDRCLKVFQHNDYVTCIQFNPVDDRYFISGSIDGKVRIWGVSENRVVDWADIRDIVTAVCYRPDGKGFIVGSIAGCCRFYDYSDNTMQLGTQFCVCGKKKSAGKRITALQFSPEDSERVMITSADSRVRIFDGVDVVHKFRGLRKTKSHLSASFTSDGRYIVSVGEDSHVYIWNNTSGHPSSKGVKSIQSCDRFFSEGITVAVPWPGMDRIGAGLVDDNLHPPSPKKILEPPTWLKDSDGCYLGTLLFVDGISRVSATWPEEKLPRTPPSSQVYNHHQYCRPDHCIQHLTSPSATRSLVIVTASSDGSIRSFHNHGLPVRL